MRNEKILHSAFHLYNPADDKRKFNAKIDHGEGGQNPREFFVAALIRRPRTDDGNQQQQRQHVSHDVTELERTVQQDAEHGESRRHQNRRDAHQLRNDHPGKQKFTAGSGGVIGSGHGCLSFEDGMAQV